MKLEVIKKAALNLLYINIIVSLFIFLIDGGEKTFERYSITFLISGMYTFFIGLGNGFLNDYLDSKFSWTEETRKRTISAIVGTLVMNIALVYFCNYLNFIVIQGKNPEKFFNGEMNFINWFFINFAIMISSIGHARGFMAAWKNSTKKEVVEQKLIAKSANAQFESLKNQLDPHFLFNSLNVLDSLIEENPVQAQRFTNSMSKIYRYVLEQKDKELVSLEEEIDFAKTYCELLKTRFEDAVTFDFNISEEDKKGFVVPLSLQLLLENSIKHNFATSSKPLNIKIFTEKGNLIIENNLQTRELPNTSTGVGLANIVSRYNLLTERNVFVEKSEAFFRVKLPILTEKLNPMNPYTPSQEQLAYEKAAKRVEELKGFYGNLISYCIFIPFLIFINFQTSPKYHWFWWPLLGWGIGVISHGIKTFGIGTDWEERQIKKYMQKEEENAKKWK
ncbi:2TM domain-containing protein [Cloacibacterium normanense]|uniref:Histidine kinase family protein n=1 Tax=Cloacibacterium normanense TaxID=237258 RepID=A0A1E5UCP5_9FLAO|nr:2TM domain-containing protein [Cloacibacterium normanense]AZI70443.1 histidine kinase [Cloacibacterium normanense]OEL10577.1 histidine kinase family protein [Cloacibacterium normanense]SDO28363.1 Histidine kinase [Cloacibacterium normanense]